MDCLYELPKGGSPSIVRLIEPVEYGEERLSGITHERYLHFPSDAPGGMLEGIVPGLVIIHFSNKWKNIFKHSLAQDVPVGNGR